MAKPRKRHEGDTTSSPSGSDREVIQGNSGEYSDRVSERAYEIYLSRGRTHGQDFDDWLAAERELTNGRHDGGRE
jgi:Protein of unknown function (DUF2934)